MFQAASAVAISWSLLTLGLALAFRYSNPYMARSRWLQSGDEKGHSSLLQKW
ncbi:Uncharacterized protein FKW44_010859 [Caligus rogercresseyi]|uniref:Uncharacterized protein n=1 Tax=Caligus rogercresseyi TaxID=217165 RepID=A0A7T8HHF6_CALRO|nr:Uncharacterized protein FKW44_010859 [Caligus rogercresseyi]